MIGLAGRQLWNFPIGSIRSTEMRDRLPPCFAWAAIRQASPSIVTVFATNLPDGFRAFRAVSNRFGVVMPPPMKMALGEGRSFRQAGASPSMILNSGTPRFFAFCLAFAARLGFFSMPMALV